MRRDRKKGFTLPELVVALVILAVILAIGIPTAIHYIRLAEFRKNEENAKTIYMTAESVLTWYRSSGQWEEFREEVLAQGIANTAFTDERKDRIYAVTLAPGTYGTDAGKESPVLTLMDDLTYSGDLLSAGAVAVEIDVESGHVYSAFYGTRCEGLGYGTGDAGQILDMDDRAYESRRERFLGYYSAEDLTNVVDLDPVRLKVSSISLVNSETLYLNWSSNSRHDNMDLEFYVTFCEKGSGKELFRLTVDRAKAMENGWSGAAPDAASITKLPMIVDNQEIEGWSFPLIYRDGTFSLVLDGMMSADVLAALEKTGLSDTEKKMLHQSCDVSITRLARVAEIRTASGIDLADPQNIYAAVQAVSTYQNTEGDASEYRQSSVVTSNTANTMYADDTKMSGGTLKAGISAFRHLSNIRYFRAGSAAEFELNSREMDWNSEGTGVYSYTETGGIRKLKWKANDGKLEFPAIPKLAAKHSLNGVPDSGTISNLRLGMDSVPDDAAADGLGIQKTKYAGLFCEADGSIAGITFRNPSLVMAEVSDSGAVSDAPGFEKLQGVGIVAGRCTGSLTGLRVETDGTEEKLLLVSLAGDGEEKTAGIGGIAGVMQCKKDAEISGLSVSGAVTAKLPDPGAAGADQTAEEAAESYQYGIGGLFGYADLTEGVQIRKCENHADVSGNLFTGGIVGHMDGSFEAASYDSGDRDALKEGSDLAECENDGLILCEASHADAENRLEGRYFGGLAGYAHKVLVYEAASASGRASGFAYSAAEQELLKGQYVGGILGFGSDCLLIGCETENKGYILGSDYVGGIVGGMTQHENSFSRIGGGIGVTTNAGYVIGRNYVGGIVGKNDGSNRIEDCINNGVAAGYGAFIGGIVGYNGKDALVMNCVSYISDHGGEIFNRIAGTWKATGSYAGGIAGYNSGTIEFISDESKVTVKSVSGLVVGQDYVGGVVGFNDAGGRLEVEYALIGGRIYAYGDCAGGYIGLNASTEILEDEIEIRLTSVHGTCCVGGCIGANVVDLKTDTEMDGFRTNNTLGNLTAKAFAGGVIGYQRTYTAAQLGLEDAGSLRTYLQENKGKLLPAIDGENLPTEVAVSENPRKLVLADRRNSGDSLSAFANNLQIHAQMYVGGILGYCETGSGLIVRNCKNEGRIAKHSGTEFGAVADGVDIARYLEYIGCRTAEADPAIRTDMAGGITGANLTEQVIDHCANEGSLAGFTCLGGVTGFNGGGIFNCELAGNFGNASQDYVGGIAGLNIRTSKDTLSYTDAKGKTWGGYVPGTIAACGVNGGVTVTGRDTVGGITAYNLPGGVVQDSVCGGSVTGYKNYVGGLVGRNGGAVHAAEDTGAGKRTIAGRSGRGVGGLVGYNEASGSIRVSGTGDVTAVGSGVTVVGGQNVGGLVGENDGSFGTEGKETGILICKALNVRALRGNAGGIAGISSGDIVNAENASEQVTADTGLAGGIVSVNPAGVTLASCINAGSINSNYGYAGGIIAENRGTVRNCTVSGAGGGITIRSRNAAQAGAVCAVNHEGAVIRGSAPEAGVTLDGDGRIYGAVTGLNQGTVEDAALTAMPDIIPNGVSGLSVGGAAGVNQKQIRSITASESFTNFSGYHYLGGVAGQNLEGAGITDSSYAGSMTERTGAAGDCYGGIAGLNEGAVTRCRAEGLTMNIRGAYTATGTGSAEQKEAMSSHTGGIVGKNEASGTVSFCYLKASGGSITVDSGMAGGVAGYNKGMLSHCGDKTTVDKFTGDETIDKLCVSIGTTADTAYVNWQDNKDIEDLKYNNGSSVLGSRTRLILSTKGSLGGITAYNAPTGALEYCATGDWFLNNKSEDISVGTGGVIGMNETERDMKYLVNRAFVGRQLKNALTNRFAGGIIGNQNNSTAEGWTLSHCVNYGMVYGYKSHYSGGIIGQWTGNGGNIEECRNYGALQTTYAEGWVGASAGIVAQLYHAHESNTYNIISCGNFGSIYGRTGKSVSNAANDSAGILGNVTTYNKAAAQAQSFTIQVMDCVNGPGVEIYSGSMASGIAGFFSTDNPSATSIINSTGKVQLRIERCRNFAAELAGVQYMAGIFGDRYGDAGAKNTVLKDCYSVNIRSNNRQDFPVVSFTSSGNSKPDSLKGEDNYFFDALNNASSYQTAFSLAEGAQNAGQSSGTIVTGAYAVAAGLKRAGSDRAYIMHNRTEGIDFAAYLTDEGKSSGGNISGKNCYIDPSDGGVYNSNGKKIAGILFELPKDKAGQYTNTGQLNASSSLFYTYVREGWRVQEGAVEENGSKKLRAPQNVTAEVQNGKLQVTVTPAENPDPRAEQGSLCDPFKYQVEIYVGGKLAATEYLYAESGSVPIPAGYGGKIEVKVRAVSMYGDVEPSDHAGTEESTGKTLLPAPDIRAEIVQNGSGYRYEISLNNLKEYNDLAGDNWTVAAEVSGGQITLSKANPTAKVGGIENTQSITAQAKPKGTTAYIESAQVSVAAFLPDSYRPDTPLVSWNPADKNQPKAEPSVTVEGNTLEDLSITVSLTHSGPELNTPPVYRVDLVGTWKKGTAEEKENVVFATKDILVAAQSTASASFTDLPEYIVHASNLKVRIWFAETGLGPVYTYHELKTEAGANYLRMTGLDAAGKPAYAYLYSEGVENRNGYFDKYSYLSGEPVLTWLPAPVLAGVTGSSGGELTPQFDSDGSLQYTLCWDADSAFRGDARYEVSLVGIDGNNNSVLIDTAACKPEKGTYQGKDAWTLTVPAEDWSFTEIRLSVTRVGDGTKHEIGFTSSGSYKVRQRLQKPEQPEIAIVDVDELYYTVTWPAIAPETGCGTYQLYAQLYDKAGKTYGTPFPVGDVVAAGTGAEYSQTINLEEYAGKQMRFYLVARAAAGTAHYVDSAAGITRDLKVPERIRTPKVTWSAAWTYDRAKPLSVDSFRTGGAKDGLTVSLEADAASIPPGGSAYLMRACIYESEEKAKAAIQAADGSAELTGYLTVYPAAGGVIRPAEMEKAGSDTKYQHTMNGLAADYAGKWAVFQARISSGSGNVSSRWVTAGKPVRLPYVKLDPAKVQSGRVWNTVTAEISENPDLPPAQSRWSVEQTVFSWNSVDYADVCYVDLTEKTPEDKEILHRYRVHRTGKASPSIEVSEWGPDGDGTEGWNKVARLSSEQGTKTFTYPLTGYERTVKKEDGTTAKETAGGYQKTVEGTYTKDEVNAYYKFLSCACLKAELQADGGFRCTLTLPDMSAVKDEEGFALPDSERKYSSRAAFRMDVLANEAAEDKDKSPAYVGSEEKSAELK